MKKRYQPQHMTPRVQRKRVGGRVLVSALTSAMVVQGVFAPVSQAMANELPAIDTSFSRAAQRRIVADSRFASIADTLAVEGKGEADKEQIAAELEQAKADAERAHQAWVEASRKENGDRAAELKAKQEAYDAAVAELNAQKAAYDRIESEINARRSKVDAADAKRKDAAEQLDKAKSDYADAQKQVEDATQAVTDAQKRLDEIQAQIDALDPDDVANAEQAIKEAQDAVDAASSALDAANAELSRQEGALSQAQGAYDAATAKVGETQSALTAAEGQLSSAQEAYNQAQSALDVALALPEDQRTDDAEIAALQDAVNQAQGALASAQQAYDTAVANKNAADAEVTECQNAIAAAQQAKQNAEQEIASKNAELEAANQALSDANAALEQAKAEHEEWEQQNSELVKKLEDAKKDLAYSENQLATAQQAVAIRQKSLDEWQAELDKWEDAVADANAEVLEGITSMDFFQDMGSDAAVGILTGTGEYDYVITGTNTEMDGHKFSEYLQLGDKDSATYIDNVLWALDTLEECNRLRVMNGLKELQVSDNMMAIAQLQADWNYVYFEQYDGFDHAKNHGSAQWAGENLMVNGYTAEGAFGEWYWAEKATADGVPSITDDHGNVHTANGQTGHYNNIIRASYALQGAAIRSDTKNGHLEIWNNTFGFLNANTTLKDCEAYTVDEYRQRIYDWIAAQGGDGLTQDASFRIKAAQEHVDSLTETIADLQESLVDPWVRAVKQDQATVDDIERQMSELGEPDISAAEAAVAAAQDRIDDATQAVSDAEQKAAQAQDDIDAETERLAGLQNAADDARDAVDAAQDGIDAANDGVEDAQGKLDACRALPNTDELTRIRDEKSDAVTTAQGVVDEKRGEHETALSEQESAATALEAAQDAYDAAQSVVDGKQDALDDANDVLQQAIEENEAIYDLFVSHDEAQKDVDASEDAVEAANAALAEIERSLPGFQQAYDAAVAALAAAQAEFAPYADLDAEDIVANGFASTDGLDQKFVNDVESLRSELADAVAAAKDAQAKYDEAVRVHGESSDAAEAARIEYEQELARVAYLQALYDQVSGVEDPSTGNGQSGTSSTGDAPLVQVSQPAGDNDASGAGRETMPQTGDNAMASVAMTAVAGAALLTYGASRRRRTE